MNTLHEQVPVARKHLRLCCHEALLVFLADQLDDVAAAGDGGRQATAGGGPVADHVEVV